MSSRGLNQMCKTILETGDRWAASFVPEITAFAPKEGEDGETITPEQQHAEAVQEANAQAAVEDTSAVDWARERAAKQVENHAKSIKGVKKFTI